MTPDTPAMLDDLEPQPPLSWWQRLKYWLLSSTRPIVLENSLALPAGEVADNTANSTFFGSHQTLEATPQAPSTDNVLATRALEALADRLAVEEVDPLIAHGILLEVTRLLPKNRWDDEVEVFAEAANILMQICPIAGGLKLKKGGQTVVALVGPTGVGKSTMIAKLASIAAHKEGLAVGLITTDTYRIAAVDQMRAYARLLELPIAVARSRDEMQEALTAYAAMDIVFVDTAGQSPNEVDRLKELEVLLAGQTPIRRYLVVSATTKHSDILDILKRFEPVGYDALIINKLDESRTHGVLLNAPQQCKKPLAYLGIGQNVPQDLEVATRERLADLILHLSGRFVISEEDE